jgi:hypothetical protein
MVKHPPCCRPAAQPLVVAWYPQVLRDDQHVYIVNSNPQFTPLMREASLRCTNPNVWWYWSSWQPGMLSRPGSLLVRDHQPVARLLSSRGLKMVNVHAQHSAQGAAAVSASPTGTSTSAGVSSRGSSSVGSSSNVGSTSSPSSSSSSSPSTSSLRLDALDTWRLWGRRRQRGFRGGPPEPHGKDVLRGEPVCLFVTGVGCSGQVQTRQCM